MRTPKNEQELLDALAYANRTRPVVFIVGSGLTSPSGNVAGVPGALEMIARLADLVTEHRPSLSKQFTDTFLRDRDYKGAFQFLKDQNVPDDLIDEKVRRAVLEAYPPDTQRAQLIDRARIGNSDACIETEFDVEHWALRPGLNAFAEILSKLPKLFGKAVLTTNFDPMIEVAVRLSGGSPVSLRLSQDGSLQHIDAWVQVIHVHGYWHGPAEMLHTQSQLSGNRPRLQFSIQQLLQNSEVCVIGYGGWDDILVRSLNYLVSNNALRRIHWCFFGKPPTELSEPLSELFGNANAIAYTDIDADRFLPSLRDKLVELKYFAPQADSKRLALEAERAQLQAKLANMSGELENLRAQANNLNSAIDILNQFKDELTPLPQVLGALPSQLGKVTDDIRDSMLSGMIRVLSQLTVEQDPAALGSFQGSEISPRESLDNAQWQTLTEKLKEASERYSIGLVAQVRAIVDASETSIRRRLRSLGVASVALFVVMLVLALTLYPSLWSLISGSRIASNP